MLKINLANTVTGDGGRCKEGNFLICGSWLSKMRKEFGKDAVVPFDDALRWGISVDPGLGMGRLGWLLGQWWSPWPNYSPYVPTTEERAEAQRIIEKLGIEVREPSDLICLFDDGMSAQEILKAVYAVR